MSFTGSIDLTPWVTIWLLLGTGIGGMLALLAVVQLGAAIVRAAKGERP